MTRAERIQAVITSVKAKFAERDTLIERLQKRLAVTIWAEMDSGETINVGTEARHFGRVYRCVKQHTKALLRSPINSEYWEVVANGD